MKHECRLIEGVLEKFGFATSYGVLRDFEKHCDAHWRSTVDALALAGFQIGRGTYDVLLITVVTAALIGATSDALVVYGELISSRPHAAIGLFVLLSVAFLTAVAASVAVFLSKWRKRTIVREYVKEQILKGYDPMASVPAASQQKRQENGSRESHTALGERSKAP
jgi:hypothetical protein